MIYFSIGTPWIKDKKSDFTAIKMLHGTAVVENDIIKFNANKLESDHCTAKRFGDVNYCFYQRGDSYNFEHFVAGNVFVKSENDVVLELKPEVVKLFFTPTVSKVYQNLACGKILCHPEAGTKAIFLADIEKNEFKYSKEFNFIDPVIDFDGIFGFDKKSKSFVKIGYDLREVWKNLIGADAKLSLTPIIDGGRVIYYHGFSRFEQLEPQDPVPGHDDMVYPNSRRLNGELYCFDRNTGEKRWHRYFPIAPMDVIVYEGKVYCICEYEFLRLNIETGETECQTILNVSAQGNNEPGKQLSVVDGKIWCGINHGQNQTHCLLIIDPTTLNVERRIDIPEPYTVDQLLHYDAGKRRAYYRLNQRYGHFSEHRNPLMVIDLDNMAEAVQFERKPDINTALRASERDNAAKELWVEIKNTSLENVLRFGIIETQNQTVNYAWISRYGREGNPEFNGKVHFRCSGIDAPTSEIREQIKLIETSFNQWVQFVSVGSGDLSHRLCSIDVEYIEEGMGSSASAPADLTPDSIADSTSDVTVVNEDYFMVTQDEIKRLAENGFTSAHEAMVKFYAISGVELYIHSDGEGYATVADYRYLLRTMMELCKKDILLQDLKSNQTEAAVNFEFSVNGTQESFELPKIDTDWLNAVFVDNVNDILKKHQSKKYFRFVYVTGIENSDQCFQLCYIDDERYKVLKGCNPPFAA